MSEYKSSVLRLNVEDHDCPVCRFLNGSRKIDDLMGVIECLDVKLSDSEHAERALSRAMVNA